jgi:hypothetical protein
MPRGSSHDKINMHVQGKRWLCTEEEAKAAGLAPSPALV